MLNPTIPLDCFQIMTRWLVVMSIRSEYATLPVNWLWTWPPDMQYGRYIIKEILACVESPDMYDRYLGPLCSYNTSRQIVRHILWWSCNCNVSSHVRILTQHALRLASGWELFDTGQSEPWQVWERLVDQLDDQSSRSPWLLPNNSPGWLWYP